MKLINKNNTTGGRPLFLNDLLTVEENFYKHSQAQFQNQGAFIISGVISAQNTISPGIVIIDNEVMSFEGAAGVSFPVYLVRQENYLENVTFQDGITRPLYIENKAVISTSIPSTGEYISVTANGGKRYTDVLMNELVGLKGNQTIAGNKSFSNTVTVGGVNVKTSIESLDQNKANKSQENWKNLSLNSGAESHSGAIYGHPIPAPGYMKDSMGFVHLRGVLMLDHSKVPNYVAATLPAGYRPEFCHNLTTGDNVWDRIYPDGRIWSSSHALILDGIIFKAV